MLISWIGTWGQTVGAQWLLVDAPNAAALVSLVQAVTTLPADAARATRRRAGRLLRSALAADHGAGLSLRLGILLAVLTAADQMPPALLLAFTFALGAGGAVQLPAWQATMPELVPRNQLRAATRLDLVSVNGARSIGPALAGLVIAYLGGVPVVFALYAVCVAFFGVVLLLLAPGEA